MTITDVLCKRRHINIVTGRPRMSSRISEHDSTAIQSKLDIAPSFASRSLFWKSKYLVDSPFLAHLPFAFWLAEVARPSSIVEVGTDDGQCYFAFCQAVERLGLTGRCRAFCTPDDTAAFSKLQSYNSDNYEEISRIVLKEPVNALSSLHDEATDILIINVGRMNREDLVALSGLWQAKLSDRGMVLLYNYENTDIGDEVASLLSDIAQEKGKDLIFDTADDLVLVLYGRNIDNRLKQLVEIKQGSIDYNLVHSVFRRLGSSHFHEWQSRKHGQEAEEERQRNEGLRSEIRSADKKLRKVKKKAQKSDLKHQEASQNLKGVLERNQATHTHEITTLTRLAEEQANTISALRTQVDRHRQEMVELRAAHATEHPEADARITALQVKLRTLQTKLDADGEIHAREVKSLTQIAQVRTEELKRLSQAATEWQSEITRLREQKAFSERYRQTELKLRDAHIARLQMPKRERARHDKRLAEGQVALVSKSALFDGRWYLEAYPDVKAAGVEPARHFVLNGLYEGRKPNPKFDTVSYYIQHPDALQDGLNPVAHAEMKKDI